MVGHLLLWFRQYALMDQTKVAPLLQRAEICRYRNCCQSLNLLGALGMRRQNSEPFREVSHYIQIQPLVYLALEQLLRIAFLNKLKIFPLA
jgi:hypothetical protein